MRTFFLVSGVLALSSLLPPALPVLDAQAGSRLVVIVEGLRNDVGMVRGALYHEPGTWLDHAHPASRCRAAIHGGRARCVFNAVPEGVIAFAGVHDEDGNGDMTRDAVGVPTEGYAFSNDARPGLTPPSFESATLPAGTRTTTVHVHYGL